jgi:A/G-specific adenine glycosylase
VAATPAALLATPLRTIERLIYPVGFYRTKAAVIHGLCRDLLARFGGRVPDDLDALRALPGIGPYTARAVLAFAYERDVAVVDTNIARVLARVAGERLTMRRAQGAADALVPAGSGWVWNQVLMDLGATVCRPTPRCTDCPLAPSCAWHVAGHPAPDPAAGSAGVSTRQAPYAGSARQARGAVLRALHDGPRPATAFDAEIVAGLVADRLVTRSGDTLELP